MTAILLTGSALADDPAAAREHYNDCRDRLDNGDPCAALEACEKGLAARKTSPLEKLTKMARVACDAQIAEEKLVKKLAKVCKDVGKTRTRENQGECCYPGQRYRSGECSGAPERCPNGYAIDDASETCVLVACEEGKTHIHSHAGAHCCWPDQLWVAQRSECVGVPTCPDGFVVAGSECEVYIPDADGDGFPDAEDQCIDSPEDVDGFEDDDGCPEYDNDRDGICDPQFAGLAAEQSALENPVMLCRDSDSCPLEAEDRDDNDDRDGCPDPDDDFDGIEDVYDACPLLEGVRERRGCPLPDPLLGQLGWATLGLGGAMLIGAGGVFVAAELQRSSVRDAQRNADGLIDSLTEREAIDKMDSANALDVAGLALLAVSGSTLIGAATLLIIDAVIQADLPEIESREEDPELSVGPGSVQLTIRF